MKENYSAHLDKIVLTGIETKEQTYDILFGLKEISGKLDTLIVLQQAELNKARQTDALKAMVEAFQKAIRDSFEEERA